MPKDQAKAVLQIDPKVQLAKVDAELGIVFGFAIVCKIDGEDYYDLQGDHIPESAMLEATADFMKSERVMLDMHDGESKGQVVFAFPLTTDIAKALGIETKTTGLIIGMKPDDSEILGKFASGEYSGFSIGGSYIETLIVE